MAYPETVSITTNSVTKENASVTYSVNAGSLPAEPSTTAGVAKSPAGTLYPSYEGAPNPKVSAVEIVDAGSGYVVNDQLTIDLDIKDAKLKVTSITPNRYSVATATASGTMSGYAANETITIPGAEGDTSAVLTIASVTPVSYSIATATPTIDETVADYVTGETVTIMGEEGDVPAVLTITASEEAGGIVTALTVTNPGSFAQNIAGQIPDEKIVYEGQGVGLVITVTTSSESGAITALTVTTAGDYAEDKAGEVSSFVYEGTGTGLVLAVTTSSHTDGAITGVSISDIGENTTDEIENPVSVTGGTGSGATFNVTLSL